MGERKNIVNANGKMTPVRTVQREKCIAMLITGDTIKSICSRLKIVPSTVYRWMTEKDFTDKLEQGLSVIRVATIQASCELIQPAFDAIGKAIEEGDAKIALALLKELGALKTGGTGAGFETDNLKGSGLKVIINVSGHSDAANIKDIDASTVEIDT